MLSDEDPNANRRVKPPEALPLRQQHGRATTLTRNSMLKQMNSATCLTNPMK